jgi:hypothetical protein
MSALGALRERWRARRPPAEATARIDRDERITAWARTTDGGVVLATVRGLWLPDRERVSWHRVHKATWADGTLTLTGAEEPEPGVVVDTEPVTVDLAEPGALPAEVRERVTRSVGYSAHHRLPGGGGARVVGRRVPGTDGLSFVVRYDDGTDSTDPQVRAEVAKLVDAARSGVGDRLGGAAP